MTTIQQRRGTAAAWTSANPTLAAGEPGFETDTGKFKIGDGATAWNSLAYLGGGGGSSPLTTKGDVYGYDSADARIPVGTDGDVLTADSAQTLGLKWATPGGGGGGALAAHPNPLDAYAIDGTYGDDFTGASLSGIWTRRNYTAVETFQLGQAATWMRIPQAGRAVGDGYFQTAPAGDWTFAMSFIPRFFSNGGVGWGIAVIDSSGTGVAIIANYSAPVATLLIPITTYTSYGGSYYEVGTGASGSPNLGVQAVVWSLNDRKVWMYLRKSSTSYYAATSFDGEIWSPEGGPITWAGTVDRVGMMDPPLGVVHASSIASFIDIDIFNKIA